jgi:hypothetical protein
MQASSPGAWGNLLTAAVDYDGISDLVQDDLDAIGVASASDLFNVTITDTGTGAFERFANVSLVESTRRIDRLLALQSKLARVQTDGSGNPRLPTSGRPPATTVNADGSGDDGQLLGNDWDNASWSEDKKTGIYALLRADIFNLLCLPPDIRDQDTPQVVYQKALALCRAERAFLICDPPNLWINSTPNPLDLGLTGQDARNAGVFYPRVKQVDPLRGSTLDSFVPCGIIAGVMARTDADRGVWKAAAGLDASLSGVQGLAIQLTDGDSGQLNPLGVNCLRAIPGAGPVVWGSRTLRGSDRLADEYRYIAVRRTALYIEESLFRGLQWVVFEPNDEPLWAQIRLNVTSFMQSLFRQGAFQGRTPKEAYLVKCDRETTTQDDIDRGIVNILVGFAPLKPAEFVIVKLQQLAGQAAA